MSDRPDREEALFQMLQRVSVEDADRSGIGKAAPADEPTSVLEEGGKDKQVSVTHPGTSGVVNLKNLFQHRLSHPIALDLMLLHKYGHLWLTWEPETLQMHLAEDFGGSSDLCVSKIMAVKTLHLVDSFWEQWEVFGWCAMPFNDMFPDFDMMQVPTVAQCAVAVDVAGRIRGDVPWSNEVKLYLEAVHKHDDIYVTQPPLDFIQVESPGMPIDKAAISKRWPNIRISKVVPKGDSIEDEQLRRMLQVFEYLTESRERLHQQLSLVQHASI